MAAVAAVPPGRELGHRGLEKRAEAVSEVERRGLLPRSVHHCTHRKDDTLLFSSLSFKDFFVGFVLFFKKALRSATGYIYKT